MSGRTRIAQFALIGQFLATLLLLICFALGLEIDDDTIAALVIGLLMAQILLTAVWSTMAPVSLVLRMSTGVLSTLFLLICFYRVAWRDGGGHGVALSICVPILIQWFLLQIPLWFARYHGWRVGNPDSQLEHPKHREFQFGIKQLLMWTTVVALSVAIVKACLKEVDFGGGTSPLLLEVGLYLTIGNSLIALPIIWGAFVHRWAWVWYLISILVCAAVCTIEFWLVSGPAMQEEFLIVINISQMVLAMMAMLVVRQLGWRLQQIKLA